MFSVVRLTETDLILLPDTFPNSETDTPFSIMTNLLFSSGKHRFISCAKNDGSAHTCHKNGLPKCVLIQVSSSIYTKQFAGSEVSELVKSV